MNINYHNIIVEVENDQVEDDEDQYFDCTSEQPPLLRYRNQPQNNVVHIEDDNEVFTYLARVVFSVKAQLYSKDMICHR